MYNAQSRGAMCVCTSQCCEAMCLNYTVKSGIVFVLHNVESCCLDTAQCRKVRCMSCTV